MKRKSIIIAVIMLLPLCLQGQNLDDALRYSQQFYQGTARFNGMGGAFTALGGDMSAIMLNPASAAVFRSTEISFSPQLTLQNISTTFGNSVTGSSSSAFNLGQFGFVFSIPQSKGSGIEGLSFAYTYNRTNNFNKYFVIDGTSSSSSIADYFASQADGNYTSDLSNNTTLGYMGYYTYLIDTVSNSYTDYSSIFSYYDEEDYTYGQRMTRVVNNSGSLGEHTIAVGANWGNKFYLGASIGISPLSYTGDYEHTENDEDLLNPWFRSLDFVDHFEADGTGWNFKIGAIVKPIEMLRIGFSFQTPTIYNISEVYYRNLTASYDVDMNGSYQGGYDFDIQQDPASYSYRITTPARINAGVALQIGTLALVSADYEYVDYTKAKLSHGADGYDFVNENSDLKSSLKGTNNLRLGAELRLGSLYLRGGYRFYGSSFKEGSLNEDWTYNMYSAGIGYRQKSFYLDLSFTDRLSSESYMMYDDAPYLDPTSIDNNDKMITATVGLKF